MRNAENKLIPIWLSKVVKKNKIAQNNYETGRDLNSESIKDAEIPLINFYRKQ